MIEPGRVAFFDYGSHYGKHVVIAQILDFHRVYI